jgi:hypothetical protein
LLAPDSVVIGEKVFRKCCEESPSPQAAREMPGQNAPRPLPPR